jgi:hypothetical protein
MNTINPNYLVKGRTINYIINGGDNINTKFINYSRGSGNINDILVVDASLNYYYSGITPGNKPPYFYVNNNYDESYLIKNIILENGISYNTESYDSSSNFTMENKDICSFFKQSYQAYFSTPNPNTITIPSNVKRIVCLLQGGGGGSCILI